MKRLVLNCCSAKLYKYEACNCYTDTFMNMTTTIIPNHADAITAVKQKGFEWVQKIIQKELTYTKPGSLLYLLYGEKPSEQSVSIKMGRLGELITKELIQQNGRFSLLKCGVQNINDRKKDVDLLFEDKQNNIIYYRELKGNIELDTEKIPATVSKCKEIQASLQQTYPTHTVNFGVLNWSVYDRSILTAGLSNIKSFETNGVKIEHMCDFLQIIETEWEKKDYYDYFREIGTYLKTHTTNTIMNTNTPPSTNISSSPA